MFHYTFALKRMPNAVKAHTICTCNSTFDKNVTWAKNAWAFGSTWTTTTHKTTSDAHQPFCLCVCVCETYSDSMTEERATHCKAVLPVRRRRPDHLMYIDVEPSHIQKQMDRTTDNALCIFMKHIVSCISRDKFSRVADAISLTKKK